MLIHKKLHTIGHEFSNKILDFWSNVCPKVFAREILGFLLVAWTKKISRLNKEDNIGNFSFISKEFNFLDGHLIDSSICRSSPFCFSIWRRRKLFYTLSYCKYSLSMCYMFLILGYNLHQMLRYDLESGHGNVFYTDNSLI